MVNARAKGSRNEKKYIDELVSQSWLVDRVEKKGKFLKEKDLFGLFDLIALKGNITMLVQVTTNRPHTHKDYSDFAKKWYHPLRRIRQVVWYDRKGWVIFDYDQFKKDKVDNRK